MRSSSVTSNHDRLRRTFDLFLWCRVMFLLAVFLALPVIATAGTNYYVMQDPSAFPSDNNDGQVPVNTGPHGPWLTIGKAARTAFAGDTIYVQAGSYDERVTPANSGSSGSPITYVGGTGRIPSSGLGAKVRGFTLTNKSYITIEGFEITNAGMSSDSSVSIDARHTNYGQILNNFIHDTSSTAINTEVFTAGQSRRF
jgi:hypothetical protein